MCVRVCVCWGEGGGGRRGAGGGRRSTRRAVKWPGVSASALELFSVLVILSVALFSDAEVTVAGLTLHCAGIAQSGGPRTGM